MRPVAERINTLAVNIFYSRVLFIAIASLLSSKHNHILKLDIDTVAPLKYKIFSQSHNRVPIRSTVAFVLDEIETESII